MYYMNDSKCKQIRKSEILLEEDCSWDSEYVSVGEY